MTAKVALPLFNQNNGNIEKVAHIWTDYLMQFGLRSKTGLIYPLKKTDNMNSIHLISLKMESPLY